MRRCDCHGRNHREFGLTTLLPHECVPGDPAPAVPPRCPVAVRQRREGARAAEARSAATEGDVTYTPNEREIYVTFKEARRVANGTDLKRFTASGELQGYWVAPQDAGARPCKVYRLADLLALRRSHARRNGGDGPRAVATSGGDRV